DERKIDILPFDFRSAAHVTAQSSVLGKGARLGRRDEDKTVCSRLAGDDAPDVGGLFVDCLACVGFWLDPVNECGKTTVGAALCRESAKFRRNSLTHGITPAFPALVGRLVKVVFWSAESQSRGDSKPLARFVVYKSGNNMYNCKPKHE